MLNYCQRVLFLFHLIKVYFPKRVVEILHGSPVWGRSVSTVSLFISLAGKFRVFALALLCFLFDCYLIVLSLRTLGSSFTFTMVEYGLQRKCHLFSILKTKSASSKVLQCRSGKEFKIEPEIWSSTISKIKQDHQNHEAEHQYLRLMLLFWHLPHLKFKFK